MIATQEQIENDTDQQPQLMATVIKLIDGSRCTDKRDQMQVRITGADSMDNTLTLPAAPGAFLRQKYVVALIPIVEK